MEYCLYMVKYQPYLNLFSNKTDNSDGVIGNAPVLEMGRYRFESYSEFKKSQAGVMRNGSESIKMVAYQVRILP